MAVSPELAAFCASWRQKAEGYSREEIRDAFDRFFTIYVIFNRLYAEATFRLARRRELTLRNTFPDSKGATDYVLKFCGANTLTQAWEADGDASAALAEIIDQLRQSRFAVKLHMVTGEPQPEEDRTLLARLESPNGNQRAKAVLEMLYAIRCNMFHGHKRFVPIQLELLKPAVALLESTIEVLHRTLDNDSD